MSRFFYLICFLSSFFITSCNVSTRKVDTSYLIIENFKLNHYSKDGTKLYMLETPYSVFNQTDQSYLLNETNIKFYEKENVKYNVNLYLNKKEPWSLIKDDNNINDVKLIIYNVLEATRIIGTLIKPILPEFSNKILTQLGENDLDNKDWEERLKWGLLQESNNLQKPIPIINKLDYE